MHTWRKPQGRWSVDALMAVIVNCDTRNVILLRCTVQLCNTSVEGVLHCYWCIAYCLHIRAKPYACKVRTVCNVDIPL